MKTKLFKKLYDERSIEDQADLKVNKQELRRLEIDVRDFEEAMNRAKALVKENIDFVEVNCEEGSKEGEISYDHMGRKV